MATMTTEQTKELAALRAENAQLREALQFGLDNMHRWTGTSGPGSMEFIEKARAALGEEQ